jgi:hypothetical protein
VDISEINMTEKKQDTYGMFGLHIFRILCCIGVLIYHVADDTFIYSGGDFSKSRIAYYLASYCIPGFFMLSGFFTIRKPVVDLKYCETKAKALILKLLGCYAVLAVLTYIVKGSLPDVVKEFQAGFLSGGILPVTWFVFTLVIIYVVFAYPVSFLAHKYPRTYIVVTLIIMVILGAIKTGFLFKGINPYYFSQSLWLMIYVPFWCFGGTLSLIDKFLLSKCPKVIIYVATSTCILILSAVYLFEVKAASFKLNPADYYGDFLYTIWIAALFILFMKIESGNALLRKIGSILSKNTMSVYLSHLPILLIFTSYFQIRNFHSVVLVVISLFVIGNLLAELFKKMPFFRNII